MSPSRRVGEILKAIFRTVDTDVMSVDFLFRNNKPGIELVMLLRGRTESLKIKQSRVCFEERRFELALILIATDGGIVRQSRRSVLARTYAPTHTCTHLENKTKAKKKKKNSTIFNPIWFVETRSASEERQKVTAPS